MLGCQVDLIRLGFSFNVWIFRFFRKSFTEGLFSLFVSTDIMFRLKVSASVAWLLGVSEDTG